MDQVADLFADLMTKTLGYEKFIAAGGDGGSIISMSLSQRHPEVLLGYHVTDVGYPDQTTDFSVLTPPEQAYAGAIQQWFFAHGAFNLVHATKPQSLAFAMNDSPVGLAAWILSFMAGMGVGDEADARFGRDELITNIMIYWLTETAASSFRIYSQNAMQPPVRIPASRWRWRPRFPFRVACACRANGRIARPPAMWSSSTTWRGPGTSQPGRTPSSSSATSASSQRYSRADRNGKARPGAPVDFRPALKA
jgi:pimeloyl-ACP methyl ester carboxylesterase